MVPIRDVVIFPYTKVAFKIGRTSSVKALEQAMAGERQIFLATQHDATIDEPTDEQVYEVGTLGRILQAQRLDNGHTLVRETDPCRITEIGAYRVKNGEVTDEFQTLVNPEMPIPRFITELTGISDDMVAGAPVFADIADDFLSFIGDSILVAHNSGFDMRFLNSEIARVFPDYRVANPCLCTVLLSRKLLPDIENHRNPGSPQGYPLVGVLPAVTTARPPRLDPVVPSRSPRDRPP